MKSNKKIQKITVTTGHELVEADRKSLLESMKTEPDWWKGSKLSDRVRIQFGDTLTEKDGLIYPNGDPYDRHRCNICGKIPDVHEEIIKMNFSFCNEYSCGMNICRRCVKYMSHRLKNCTK